MTSIARFVRDACGEAALEELLTRFAFVVGSGNTDAHLENWAIWFPDGVRPRLAPCDDQVATISWAEEFGWRGIKPPALALSLGGERAMHRLDRGCLQQVAKRLEVRASSVVGPFMGALEAMRATWPILDRPAVMDEALREHWGRVPLCQQAGALGPPTSPQSSPTAPARPPL